MTHSEIPLAYFQGRTALHQAVVHHPEHQVSYPYSCQRRTAVHQAVRHAVVECLLSKGADVDAKDPDDNVSD